MMSLSITILLFFCCTKAVRCDDGCQESLGVENDGIPNDQISASSELSSNHAAIQGRLNFQATSTKAGAWSARTNDGTQWLQIDLGHQQIKVTHVATQGRNGVDEWVTKYKLKYSTDGVHFQFYREQGSGSIKEFTGNTDQDTIVNQQLCTPIRARYIRFLPSAWNNHISMRVALYGCKECQQALGMESGIIPNKRISASSQWDINHAAIQSRLNFEAKRSKAGSWSARRNDADQWLQIDTNNQLTSITGVATQGRNNYRQWVTRYRLQYSDDGNHFQYYMDQANSVIKEFTGNSNSDTVVYHELNPAIRARYIRFRPTAWFRHISMRVEIYGCQVCQQVLGMESGVIPNERITASSQLNANHAAIQARLNFQATSTKAGSWSARTNDVNQWLQVDLAKRQSEVTSMATQGGNGVNQWVTKYKLQYSDGGVHFQYYRQPGQTSNTEFAGNTDSNTITYHELNSPIRARYIRFRPTAWNGHITMRVELYGCTGCQSNRGIENGAIPNGRTTNSSLNGCKETNECQQALGMESGAIPNERISASSQWDINHAAIQSRLNFEAKRSKAGSWSARRNDADQWLQIDTNNQLTNITGVATQGRNNYRQWVTRYRLQYSDDGNHFQYYMDRANSVIKDFTGNSNSDTVVYHELNPTIRARYIRFRPTAWFRHISMRVEIYGCQGTLHD